MSQQIIDYAYPCMMAEKALKEVHTAMLAKNYDEAIERALTASTEVKMMLNSIKLMQEDSYALRQ
jgi:hypothetical protein